MRKAIEFMQVFVMYAKHNPLNYAARIAYEIVYQGLPF